MRWKRGSRCAGSSRVEQLWKLFLWKVQTVCANGVTKRVTVWTRGCYCRDGARIHERFSLFLARRIRRGHSSNGRLGTVKRETSVGRSTRFDGESGTPGLVGYTRHNPLASYVRTVQAESFPALSPTRRSSPTFSRPLLSRYSALARCARREDRHGRLAGIR